MQQELSQPYFYSFDRNDIGKIVLFKSEVARTTSNFSTRGW